MSDNEIADRLLNAARVSVDMATQPDYCETDEVAQALRCEPDLTPEAIRVLQEDFDKWKADRERPLRERDETIARLREDYARLLVQMQEWAREACSAKNDVDRLREELAEAESFRHNMLHSIQLDGELFDEMKQQLAEARKLIEDRGAA